MNTPFQQLLDELYLSATHFEHWYIFTERLISFFSTQAIQILIIDKKIPEHSFSIYYDIQEDFSSPIPLENNTGTELAIQPVQELIIKKNPHRNTTITTLTTTKSHTNFIQNDNLTQVFGSLIDDNSYPVQADFHAGLRLYRDANQEPFNQNDKNNYANLIPHFVRAVKLHRLYVQKNELCSGSYSIMEYLPYGVVVTDKLANTEYMNQKTKQLFNNLVINIQNEKLTCFDNEMNIKLRALILKSTQEKSRQILSIPRENLLPIYISIAPVSNNTTHIFQHKPKCIICITDPSLNEDIPFESIMELFNLSPSEAKLTCQLVKTGNLKSAREFLGISNNTARFYLKNIFSKMNISNQSELIKSILSSPAVYNKYHDIQINYNM